LGFLVSEVLFCFNCMDMVCADVELVKVPCWNASTIAFIECRPDWPCELYMDVRSALLLICSDDGRDLFCVFKCGIIYHVDSRASEAALPVKCGDSNVRLFAHVILVRCVGSWCFNIEVFVSNSSSPIAWRKASDAAYLLSVRIVQNKMA
jgi:hypothetical protein